MGHFVSELAGFAHRINEVKKVKVTYQADVCHSGQMLKWVRQKSGNILEVVAPGTRY